MSVNIYDSTNDELNQIAGREDTSYWEGTQAQWNALSSADKALWTGKYVIITDDEESVNKYNGTELINIAGKGANGDTKDCTTTFTSADDSTESGLILPSGGDITVPQIVSGDTHGNLFSGLSKIALNTRKLINTVKRVWNSVGATWVSGHAYAVNDMVVYKNGHVYKCKAAHTSSSSILPTNTTYWTDTTLAAEIASLNTNYAKVLWTNNGSYGHGQINLISNNYSHFLIIIYGGPIAIITPGSTGEITMIGTTEGLGGYNSRQYIFGRGITNSSQTSITITTCYRRWVSDTQGNWLSGDDQLKPYQVIGFNPN